jgi:hypothetical protein
MMLVLNKTAQMGHLVILLKDPLILLLYDNLVSLLSGTDFKTTFLNMKIVSKERGLINNAYQQVVEVLVVQCTSVTT